METEISKSRFKARALEIFRKIEKTGTPVAENVKLITADERIRAYPDVRTIW